MATPAWIGATPSSPPLAAQVNQFLTTHAITYLYSGAYGGGQTTLGSGGVNSNGLYIAQSFTAAATYSLGRVVLGFNTVTGTPTAPTTISIQTSTGGAPSGTALISTTVPPQFLASNVSIPVPCALASGTVYWIVLAAVGDASNFATWLKSNQTSGASTSTNGTSWTAQAYGLYYALWDQSAFLPLAHTWEDGGARWTSELYTGVNELSSLQECTVAQGSGQYVSSSRALTYSGSNLISVA
jgi:hypothetical protein